MAKVNLAKTAAATAVALAAGMLLTGCANPHTPAPAATDFPMTSQPKLQAAAHWGVIAGTIEQRLTDDLRKAPPRPYYVAEPPQDASPFQRALTEHITSALVKSGHVVSRAPAGSLKVDIDVQALTFSAQRAQKMPGAIPTALAVGVWMLAATTDPVLATAGGVAAHEAYNHHFGQFANGPTPKTELIVTVSVSDQYRYYARNSSAYYVADSDRSLYGLPADDDKAVKTFSIRGDK